MRVLSLFDGMSCGRLALERSGFKIDKYYASEIAPAKIKASQNYFPNNIYIGDIQQVSGYDYDIDLLIGGSPCQGFSIMGDRLNFDDPRSGLIMDYFRILEEIREHNPNVKFLLENVPMNKQCEIEISRRLGVLPVKINSALLSAQNRKRIYWTNIPGTGVDLFGDEIEQPADKGVMLRDILQPESEIDEKYYLSVKAEKYVKARISENEKYCNLNPDKSRAIQEGYASRWNGTFICNELFNIHPSSNGAAGRVYGTNAKSPTITAKETGGHRTLILDDMRIRKITPVEACRLQTISDDFFLRSGLSDSRIYSCVGDGWTIDIIVHIFKGLKPC